MERIPVALPPARDVYALKSLKNKSKTHFQDYCQQLKPVHKPGKSDDNGINDVDLHDSENVSVNSYSSAQPSNNEKNPDLNQVNDKQEAEVESESNYSKTSDNTGEDKLHSNTGSINSELKSSKNMSLSNMTEKISEYNKSTVSEIPDRFFIKLFPKERIPEKIASDTTKIALNNKLSISEIADKNGNSIEISQTESKNLKLFTFFEGTDTRKAINLTEYSDINNESNSFLAKNNLLNSSEFNERNLAVNTELMNELKYNKLVANINQNNAIIQNFSLINSLVELDNKGFSRSNEYPNTNKNKVTDEIYIGNKELNKGISYFTTITIEKYNNSGKLFLIPPKSTLDLTLHDVKPMEFTQRTLQILNNINSNGIGKARLILKPPALGTIFVDFVLDRSILKLNIKAENQEVVRIIESQIIELKDKLAQSGLKLDALEVKLKDNYDSIKDNSENNFFRKNFDSKKENELRQTFAESFQLLKEEKKLDEGYED
jgi:hypothetical protein